MNRIVRLGVVELPDGLSADSSEWQRLKRSLAQDPCDLLLLNEMPFGRWLPSSDRYEAGQAEAWARLHEAALPALKALPVRSILSTRPVMGEGRLVNEGFALIDGRYEPVHHKHYFPEEEGWWEASWFATTKPGFDVIEIDGLRVGFMICTELFLTNGPATTVGRTST